MKKSYNESLRKLRAEQARGFALQRSYPRACELGLFDEIVALNSMRIKRKGFKEYRKTFLKTIEEGKRDSFEDFFNGVYEEEYKQMKKLKKEKGALIQAEKIRKTFWWNNGIETKRSEKSPGSDWKKGRGSSRNP